MERKKSKKKEWRGSVREGRGEGGNLKGGCSQVEIRMPPPPCGESSLWAQWAGIFYRVAPECPLGELEYYVLETIDCNKEQVVRR